MKALRPRRPTVDPAGTAAAGTAAASVLHGTLGTATDGAVDYNLLFRWFVGLSMDEPVWDMTVFCKNRDRLLEGDIAVKFFVAVLNLPEVHKLLSDEHFSVDGTLI